MPVHQLHEEVRITSYVLYPLLLDESGLASAIGSYIDGIAERTGLKIRLDASEEFESGLKDTKRAAFRTVQECLTK